MTVLAALALGVVGLVLPVTSASARPMAGESTVTADCVSRTGAASGRHANSRFDPHELTRAQAAAMDARLKKTMKVKGVKVNSHGKVSKGKPPGGGGGTFTGAQIPVHWHVITDGATGEVPAQRLSDQIRVLNAAYAGSGFPFKTVSPDTTINAAW
jgi:hypothetical protein